MDGKLGTLISEKTRYLASALSVFILNVCGALLTKRNITSKFVKLDVGFFGQNVYEILREGK